MRNEVSLTQEEIAQNHTHQNAEASRNFQTNSQLFSNANQYGNMPKIN